jgi:hypothetical protein
MSKNNEKLSWNNDSWANIESENKFSKLEIIELYKVYSQNRVSFIDLRHKYTNYYTGIQIAILSGIALVIINFNRLPENSLIYYIIATGFFLNILISTFALNMNERNFQAAIENVTMLAKIEALLGLDEKICIKDKKMPNIVLWPKDKSFIPERYRNSTSQHLSKIFVNKSKEIGFTNIIIKVQFYGMIILSMFSIWIIYLILK